MHLNHSLAFSHGEMPRAFRHSNESTNRHLVSGGLIEFFTNPHSEGPLEHCHIFVCWMPVWHDFVSIRKLRPNGEQPGLGWVAAQRRHLRAWRESRRRWSPF